MNKNDPIKNDDKVMAISVTGESAPYIFRQLKQDFQNKKIPFVVSKVFLIRTKEYFHINVRSTKGLAFKKLQDGSVK